MFLFLLSEMSESSNLHKEDSSRRSEVNNAVLELICLILFKNT